MITLYQSLFVSIALVLFILWRAKDPIALIWVAAVAGFAALLSIFILAPALCLHLAGTCVVAFLGWAAQANRRLMAGLLIAVPILPYAWFLGEMHARLDHLARLRQEFPLVSVADRLAYERGPRQAERTAEPPQLSAEAEHRLQTFEQRGQLSFRRSQLQSLYWRGRDEFIQATGFGPIRMGPTQP